MAHVPLAVRKALLTRIIAFEEIERGLRSCSDETACKIARNQTEQLVVATSSEIDVPNDHVPLDEYVEAKLSLIAQVFESDPRLRAVGTLAAALRAIRVRANAISCAACANPDPICDGRPLEDTIVDRGGECVSPLRTCLDVAIGIAQRYYAVACGDSIAERWPTCRFATAHVSGKAHPFNCPAQVSAKTTHGQPTEIELIVEPRTFNWRSYMAVLYVLVHEAFHVLEGSDGAQVSPDREDPFAEGWIDAVAFMAFEEALDGRGPAGEIAGTLPDAADMLDAAQMLHLARSDHENSQARNVSLRLAAGRRAAHTFFDFCKRCMASDEEGWSIFLAVSLRLNLRPMTLNQHRLIVANVNAKIPNRSKLGTPDFIETARELGKYFQTKQIDEIMNWLCRED
jgi:hypothetical protein